MKFEQHDAERIGAPEIPCEWCAAPLPDHDNVEYLVVDVPPQGRICMLRRWAFCSTVCRAAWWHDCDGSILFAIHSPDRMPDCNVCRGLDDMCTVCDPDGKVAPDFYCSHDAAHEDRAHLFDRDIEIRVFVGRKLSVGPLGGSGVNVMKASGVFACPCEVAEWWQTNPLEDGHLLPGE